MWLLIVTYTYFKIPAKFGKKETIEDSAEPDYRMQPRIRRIH